MISANKDNVNRSSRSKVIKDRENNILLQRRHSMGRFTNRQ
jgi:hypothetical protein